MISLTAKKVMSHTEFINRVRKSLYYGADTLSDDMEVSRPLAEYASELFSEPHKGHSLNRLHSVVAGTVHATPYSLIMALIYLDRLNIVDPGYLRGITPQELFIVSMMVSTKFYAGHDEEIYLSDWAEDGNMSEESLKRLELEFLRAIEWNIYISNEQFFNKLNTIEKSLAKREGLRRGWLTYTELIQLLPSFMLAKFLLSNIAVMVVSYAASVMTIAGAFFLATQIPGNALYRDTTKTTPNSAGEVSNTLLVNDNMLPATPLQALSKSNNQSSTEACNATDLPEIILNCNTSCNALNVEKELLKLEQEYREEARLENLMKRNSEITSHMPLISPAAGITVQKLNSSQENTKMHYKQLNWFAYKEEYSDDYHNDDHALHGNEIEIPSVIDCGTDFNNCTSFIFWHLLINAAHNSLANLPFMWLQFSQIYCTQPLSQQSMQSIANVLRNSNWVLNK